MEPKKNDKETEVIHTGVESPQFQQQAQKNEDWSPEELGEGDNSFPEEVGEEDYMVDMRTIDQVEFRRRYITLNTPKVAMGYEYELHHPITYTKFGETTATVLRKVKFSKDVRVRDLSGFAISEISENLKSGRMAQLISIVCGIPKDAALGLSLTDLTDLGAYAISFLANGPKNM